MALPSPRSDWLFQSMPCEWLMASRVIESAASIVGPAGTDTMLGHRSAPSCMTPRQFRSFVKKKLYILLAKNGLMHRKCTESSGKQLVSTRQKDYVLIKNGQKHTRKNAGTLAGQTTAFTFSTILVIWCSMYRTHVSFDFQIKVKENISHVRILYCLDDILLTWSPWWELRNTL